MTDDETEFTMRQARLRNMIRKSELRMQMTFRRPAEFLSRRVEVRCCSEFPPVKNMLETITWLVQRVLLWSISALGLAWIYKEITMGICHSKKRLDGKVAIVTGMIYVTF